MQRKKVMQREMKFSEPAILSISGHVILSGTETSRSEASVQSKDPCSLPRTRRHFIRGDARP